MSDKPLTVRELMMELQKLDPYATVWKAEDDEGNGFIPCYSIQPADGEEDNQGKRIKGVVIW